MIKPCVIFFFFLNFLIFIFFLRAVVSKVAIEFISFDFYWQKKVPKNNFPLFYRSLLEPLSFSHLFCNMCYCSGYGVANHCIAKVNKTKKIKQAHAKIALKIKIIRSKKCPKCVLKKSPASTMKFKNKVKINCIDFKSCSS